MAFTDNNSRQAPQRPLFGGQAQASQSNLFGGSGQQAREPLPESDIWINFGAMLPLPNAEGELESSFVSIPVGIALDTMKPFEVRPSGSVRWVKRQVASNELLKFLQEQCKGLEPGEDQIFQIEGTPFCVQFRRRRDGVDESAVSNEMNVADLLAGGFSGGAFGKPKA